MHVERVDHREAGIVTVEGEVQIGPGQHDCFGAKAVDHLAACGEEGLADGVGTVPLHRDILVELAEVVDPLVERHGAGAGQLAVKARAHDDTGAEKPDGADALLSKERIERGHGGDEGKRRERPVSRHSRNGRRAR